MSTFNFYVYLYLFILFIFILGDAGTGHGLMHDLFHVFRECLVEQHTLHPDAMTPIMLHRNYALMYIVQLHSCSRVLHYHRANPAEQT